MSASLASTSALLPAVVPVPRAKEIDGMLQGDQQTGQGGEGAMRQRILGSHTPPCHRRMVITT